MNALIFETSPGNSIKGSIRASAPKLPKFDPVIISLNIE